MHQRRNLKVLIRDLQGKLLTGEVMSTKCMQNPNIITMHGLDDTCQLPAAYIKLTYNDV